MRADRLLGQASYLFCVLVLIVLTLSFAHIPSVNAAPGTPRSDPPVKEDNPVQILQTGPDVEVAIAASFQSVTAGDAVSFTITVINRGQDPAQSVQLTSALPAVPGFRWAIQNSSDIRLCSITDNVLSCSIGNLAGSGWFWVRIGVLTGFDTCGTLEVKADVTASNEDPAGTGSNTSSASTTILCPSLAVTKTAVSTQVAAGSAVGFVISVVNTGSAPANKVQVNDPLPGVGTLDWQVTTPGAPCTITNGVLTCSPGDLPAGGQLNVQISAPTSETACGSYPNTVTVSAANHPDVQKTAQVDVLCTPLLLEKTTDTPQVNAGEPVRFTIKVTNADKTAALGVTLTDTLPNSAGLAWQIVEPVPQGCAISGSATSGGILTCAFSSLLAGETSVITITSPTTFDSCGELTNQAHLTDSAGRALDASASISVLCPALSLSKTADLPEIGAGALAGFTIVVSNTGTGAGLNVHLDDPLPADVQWEVDHPACTIANSRLTCDWASLPAQALETIHLTGSASLAACGPLNNTATLTAANYATLVSSAGITVTCPDVKVEKTADKTPLRPGDTAGFTIVVTNIGNGTAMGVSLSDTLPSGVAWSVDNSTTCQISGQDLTCTLGDLPSGQSITLKVSGVIGEACGQLTNQVTVSAGNEPEGLTGNNTAQASIDVQCLKDLVVQKTADPTFNVDYDWSISKTASRTKAWSFSGGAVYIDYTITITQTGAQGKNYRLTGQISVTNPNPSTAISGVTVTDAVSNGGVCKVKDGANQTIPAGSTVKFDYTCEYPGSKPTNVNGTNTATVTWDPSAATPNHSAATSVDFRFGSGSQGNPVGLNETVTVIDTWNAYSVSLGSVTGVSQPPYTSKAFTYTLALPAMPGCKAYSNTASLLETGQKSSVSVMICAPLHTGAQPPSFWQKEGQSIIRAKSDKSSCALTPWLRQFEPFQDLSAKAPCPAVASYVKSVLDSGKDSNAMSRELKAQTLTTALNVFYSDPNLGGNQLNAPAPIGSYTIDLTDICTSRDGDSCIMVDARSAFGDNATLTILQALTLASSQSSAGGASWYGSSTAKTSMALDTFYAINHSWVFGTNP